MSTKDLVRIFNLQKNQINELKQRRLKSELGNIGENKLLLITSIKIMDEYFETKKKIEEKKKN